MIKSKKSRIAESRTNLRSTQKFHQGISPDESVSYSVESFMKPQVIDNSHAIFSAQKIREVNYKFRKRKVDVDREQDEAQVEQQEPLK